MESVEFDPPLKRWHETGIVQEINEARQALVTERADLDYAYHAKSETHYWIVLVRHKASETMLDSLDGVAKERPLLDADSIQGAPMVFCYICEQQYSSILRKRKCPGEPD